MKATAEEAVSSFLRSKITTDSTTLPLLITSPWPPNANEGDVRESVLASARKEVSKQRFGVLLEDSLKLRLLTDDDGLAQDPYIARTRAAGNDVYLAEFAVLVESGDA